MSVNKETLNLPSDGQISPVKKANRGRATLLRYGWAEDKKCSLLLVL